jgi:hypothetical protein
VDETSRTTAAPGFLPVVKQGRLVTGAAWFEVAPLPGGRSRVTWTEEIDIAPARLTRAVRRTGRARRRVAFTRVLRKGRPGRSGAGAD